MKASLVVKQDKTILFSSDGHWLYPLFELEEFLNQNSYDPSRLELTDKIAGRAAAYLMVRLGFKKVHIGLLSQLALKVYQDHGVKITWDQLVPRIQCRTEALIQEGAPLDDVYRMLRQRAGLLLGVGVHVDQLAVGYQGKRILEPVTFSLEEGGAYLLLGENGSGKTTLLKTMAGLITPLGGGLRFTRKGEPLKVTQFGYLGQKNQGRNMPLSVVEVLDFSFLNRTLPKGEKEHRREIAMRRTGILDLASKSYYALSGGEQQRVNLARLLCSGTGFFLLDEPTNHLDKRGQEQFLQLIQEIHFGDGPTILLATHDSQVIKNLSWERIRLEGGVLCSN